MITASMPAPPNSDPHSGQRTNPVHLLEAHEPEDSVETGKDEEETDELEEDEEESEPTNSGAEMLADRAKWEAFVRRLFTEEVAVQVHEVIIKGNAKTKSSLIESEVEGILKEATTLQQLLGAAAQANARLQRLGIFDSVNITLDGDLKQLPGIANVILEVSECKKPIDIGFGVFTSEACSVEGLLKLKNLFGYGDLWDTCFVSKWDQPTEFSAGVSLPKFRSFSTPLTARILLLPQDWLKISSFKERAFGMSLGLASSGKHNLSYNLAWRALTDLSQMSSQTVRRQLGHGLLLALKYTFKIDQRDSPLRPTRGHAVVSSTQIGGIFPDLRSLRFIRLEFDLRNAVPLGFCGAALNFGLSTGVVFPWGNGSLSAPFLLPDRFFMGGESPLVHSLGGSASVLGFEARGLGPAEPRRDARQNPDHQSSGSPGMDILGGDLTVTGFVDLSFDLPMRILKDAGVYAHAFACTGSLTKLTENAHKQWSFQNFRDSFRSSMGIGIVVPTFLGRVEGRYCHILKHDEHDRGKTGFQLSFSPHF